MEESKLRATEIGILKLLVQSIYKLLFFSGPPSQNPFITLKHYSFMKKAHVSSKAFRNKVYVHPFEMARARTRLVGISHGFGKIPMGPKTQRLLVAELGKEREVVLTEHLSWIPKGQKANVAQLEARREGRFDSVTNLILSRTTESQALRFLPIFEKQAAENLEREKLHPVKLKEGLPPRAKVTEADIRRLIRFGVDRKRAKETMHLLVTVRSVLMAANILQQIRARQIQTATVVVGKGHMWEIHRFLTHPRIAQKYLGLLIRKISAQPQDPKVELLKQDLVKARSEFSKP